jgi:hypothetical protein
MKQISSIMIYLGGNLEAFYHVHHGLIFGKRGEVLSLARITD